MNSTKVLKISDIVSDAGPVELLDGKTYNMKQLDGQGWEVAERLDSGQRVSPTELWSEVARVVPDAPIAEIKRLTADQCGAILQRASRSLKAVEATAPNASGPTESSAVPSPSSA